VYTSGLNDAGQLGHSADSEFSAVPQEVVIRALGLHTWLTVLPPDIVPLLVVSAMLSPVLRSNLVLDRCHSQPSAVPNGLSVHQMVSTPPANPKVLFVCQLLHSSPPCQMLLPVPAVIAVTTHHALPASGLTLSAL
jgi:hypothetical protein